MQVLDNTTVVKFCLFSKEVTTSYFKQLDVGLPGKKKMHLLIRVEINECQIS